MTSHQKKYSILTILSFFVFSLIIHSSKACTIFFLTDVNNALFFNNEDWTSPYTRIWFIPAGKDYYGCAFVGFVDGSAEGGINTEGLSFDWWAGGYNPYVWDKNKPRAKGSSSERMLETCKTVDEAIEFYKKYAEPSFENATILVADKTGASVTIGSKDGELFFDKSNESRGIGYAESVFQKMYNHDNSVNLSNGTNILKHCVAPGEQGTKYSNVFDLRTGDIYVYQFESRSEGIALNLLDELKKGEHYYDISEIKFQISEPIKPIAPHNRRLYLYEFDSLPETDKKLGSKAKKIVSDMSNGTIDAGHYVAGFWKDLEKDGSNLKSALKPYGNLKSIHLIEKVKEGDMEILYYVGIYEYGRMLWQFGFNSEYIVQDLNLKYREITSY